MLTVAAVVGLLLFWFVLTRFRSGEINAVDFTVYYDRPAFQTLQGRPMFVETGDDVLRAQQTYFSVHAHWAMLPLSALYAIHATPLWLLAVSVIVVVAGAVSVLRIVQRMGGGLVASASALAFVLNDNTARTLNYGFHVEVLYAWLIPCLINAAMAGHATSREDLQHLMNRKGYDEKTWFTFSYSAVASPALILQPFSVSNGRRRPPLAFR